MTPWFSLHPYVLPEAQGAPAPALDRALLGAAREFYERTRVWRPWLEITTVGVTREYALPAPADSEVARLERATLNGAPFDLLQADSQAVDLSNDVGTDNGLASVSSDLKRVIFTREQATGSLLRVQAVLMPSETAAGLADPDYAQYVRAIAKGAAAELLSQSGVQWANPQRALQCRDEFTNHISAAAWRIHKGATSAVPRRRLRLF